MDLTWLFYPFWQKPMTYRIGEYKMPLLIRMPETDFGPTMVIFVNILLNITFLLDKNDNCEWAKSSKYK